MSAALFPQRAPIDEQIAWVARQKDLARRRASAWRHRHVYLSAWLRKLRRDAGIPDAPYTEFEDNDD